MLGGSSSSWSRSHSMKFWGIAHLRARGRVNARGRPGRECGSRPGFARQPPIGDIPGEAHRRPLTKLSDFRYEPRTLAASKQVELQVEAEPGGTPDRVS